MNTSLSFSSQSLVMALEGMTVTRLILENLFVILQINNKKTISPYFAFLILIYLESFRENKSQYKRKLLNRITILFCSGTSGHTKSGGFVL